MKNVVAITILLAWSFNPVEVSAQETVETDDVGAIEEPICIPAEEVEQSAGEESGPSEEGMEDEVESGLPICEEDEPIEASQDEGNPQEEATPEDTESEDEMLDDEIDPAQEFEVNPEDEISEDYPVPLPSDI